MAEVFLNDLFDLTGSDQPEQGDAWKFLLNKKLKVRSLQVFGHQIETQGINFNNI